MDCPGINGRLQEVGSKTASVLIPEATDASVWAMVESVISNATRRREGGLKDSSLFPGVSCRKELAMSRIRRTGWRVGFNFRVANPVNAVLAYLTRVSEYVSNLLTLPSFCKHCKMRKRRPQMIKNHLSRIFSHSDIKPEH